MEERVTIICFAAEELVDIEYSVDIKSHEVMSCDASSLSTYGMMHRCT
jgi:hypothetical protein